MGNRSSCFSHFNSMPWNNHAISEIRTSVRHTSVGNPKKLFRPTSTLEAGQRW